MRLKNSVVLGIALATGILCLAAAEPTTDLRLAPTDRILILAPHPDDEMLCCGGVIQEAAAKHLPLQIVFLTYGDFNKWAFSVYRRSPVFRPKTMRAMGEVRRAEALAAAHVLGVSSDALTFLGYPDYGTLTIWNDHWAQSSAYESPNTRAQAVPYGTAYRPQAPYKGEAILQDLEAILKTFQPTKVFVPHPADQNVDHRALYLFLRVALKDLAQERVLDIYTYLVHFPKWPVPRGLHWDQSLQPPSSLADPWEHFPLSAQAARMKYAALEKHRTQTAYSDRYLTSFVRSDELFGADAPDAHNESADIEDWQVASDSADLVLSGRLARKLSASTPCQAAAYGYRRGISFENMPKIQVTFKNQRVRVYDQERPLLDSGVSVRRDHRRFILRIPLKLLNQPETVFAGCGVRGSGKPFGWGLASGYAVKKEDAGAGR